MADREAALVGRPRAPHARASGARPVALAEHFETLEQQHSANSLGMWIFLASELMLFGMLFTAYVAYRARFPDAFAAGSRHLDLALGAINTAVLIISSLMMGLAEHSAQLGDGRWLRRYLALGILLGLLFLGVKGLEYVHHYQEQLVPGVAYRFEGPAANQVALFFFFYYAMTGLHAIHLTAGVIAAIVALVLASRGGLLGEQHWPVELIGMYWSFVDIIWLFLFPLLYLAGGA